MKKLSKVLSLVLTIALFSMCLAPYADAASSQMVAMVQVANFLENKELAINSLNEVAQMPAINIEECSLYNGTEVRIETRQIQMPNDLVIKNVRTITTRGINDHRVEDSYGLFWGGVAGAAGTLKVYYDYVYSDILGPNYMKTRITQAGGYGEGLDEDEYKIDGVVPRWDSAASYWAEGSVEFIMQASSGFPPFVTWSSVTYKHTCQFDNYGVPHMSWF